MNVEFDNNSDLTSLADEDEQQVNDVAADAGGLRSDSESSLTSLEEDEAEIERTNSRNGSQNTFPPAQVSPSRIGSSLSRPSPAKGLRTYGGRRSRMDGNSKKQIPKHSSEPSPEPSGYESPLTPLSSPSPSPRKRRAPPSIQQPLSSPSKRSRNRKSRELGPLPISDPPTEPVSAREMHVNGHRSSSNFPVTPTKRKQDGKHVLQNKAPALSASTGPRRRISQPKSKHVVDRTWSLEALGTLMEPNAAYQKAVRVRLFSPPYGSVESLLVTLAKPSSSSIASYTDRTYTAKSFWLLPPSSTSSWPAGFDKLKSRWEEACKRIVEEDMRLNDGFPTSLTALLSQPQVYTDDDEDDSVSRASPKRPDASSSALTQGEPWSPPPPDPNVTIPGEYVLCTTKTKGYFGKFYPAKVIAYVPPSGPNDPSRYKVHFMDNFDEDVTRDMFYIYEQEGFGTCKLGEFESVESLYEKDGEAGLEEDILAETGSHVVVPEIPLLPPPPPEEFCTLTMPEQSSYITPILMKIIENKYRPAEKRVSAFLSGGRERAKMSKDVPQKGLLTRSELNQLARILKCWTLSIDSSNGEMKDANISPEIDAHHRPQRATAIPPEEPDTLQEVPSNPDDLSVKEVSRSSMEIEGSCHPGVDSISSILTTCLTRDKEQEPSLPPSSLPPSSTIDESPSNTLNGVGDDDHGIIVAESFFDSASQPNRADQRSNNGLPPSATPQRPLSPTRTFKDLLSHEKIHFCTDVLLKEAVIQLLLWRAGKRRSIDLLSETEELLLHESGSNLAGEFDIAHTVQDLRAKKEKFLSTRLQSKQPIPAGGTRSRPKRV
ncbi:hypothetical protein ACEPAF_4624 [Sanghuangporus sanghuang]